MSSEYLSDDEIAKLAAKMRVADPTQDNGSFDSVTREDALIWLRLLGVQGLSPRSPDTNEEVHEKLRSALWDTQRLDYLLPRAASSETETLNISKPPSWPDWKKPHPELRSDKIGPAPLDGFKDAKRLDSYVFRHFQLSAFTQMENMRGAGLTAPKNIAGAWLGTKTIMGKAALDITREGGKDTPFVTYFTPNHDVLFMEILDVKQCAWPEPTKKQMELIRTCQETKFGHSANGPLVPMMQTPKFPLVIVRYSYMEGRPKEGSKFTLYLEDLIGQSMPGASVKAVREKLQWHLQTGEEVSAPHLRMLARLLSFNSGLVDPDYARELQSHWNGLSQDVISETKISFFVPCLRMRFRALEQIETGITPKLYNSCRACGKTVEKMMCASCKSVYYCNATCIKADWSKHKANCKFSKRLLDGDSTLPSNKLYVPTRTYIDFVLDHGFAVETEAVKLSGLAAVGDCPANEYGEDRFIVRATMPLDYTVAGEFKGLTAFIFDRRRSFQLRCTPGDPVFAAKTGMGVSIPFHTQGHQRFVRLVRTKGLQGQQIHLWARRIGDTLELDLEDLPSQTSKDVSWI